MKEEDKHLKKGGKLSIWGSTALVIGNMIGGGIFLLPAALGAYGGISLLGWLFSVGGTLILAYLFSQLSLMVQQKNGGPYAYTRAGFGDFMGFLVAWGYWVSVWVANAAIAVAFVGAMSVFFPFLETSRLAAVLTGLAAIWLLTGINLRGIRASGWVQLVTTALKLIPLFLIGFGGLLLFNSEHFSPFNLSTETNWNAVIMTASITLYAFLGFESATIPAAVIDKPEKTIPKATMIGTILTASVYLLVTIGIMGLIHPNELVGSPAPFADAAVRLGGSWARYFVAGGIAIATFGALNGWILILGQIPMAVAEDGLLPKFFGKKSERGVPAGSLLFGSTVVSLIMLLNYTDGLAKQFEFLSLLTTLSVLTPYLFCAAAYLIIFRRVSPDKSMIIPMILSLVAFVFCMWTIYGSGEETVFWGFLLLLAGLPFYIFTKLSKSNIS